MTACQHWHEKSAIHAKFQIVSRETTLRPEPTEEDMEKLEKFAQSGSLKLGPRQSHFFLYKLKKTTNFKL